MVLAELGIDQQLEQFYWMAVCGRLSRVTKATRRGELIDYNVSGSL